jgi:hypothetical protein
LLLPGTKENATPFHHTPKETVIKRIHNLWVAPSRMVTQHCYKLRYLNLRGCINITDTAVSAIAINSTKLRYAKAKVPYVYYTDEK